VNVFLDTSALVALLDADEARHGEAGLIWKELLGSDAGIVTTNYVLVETYALTQRRLGSAAVRVLTDDLLPVIEVEWIGRDLHVRAVSALIAANRRDLSLVDAVSFEVMRGRGLDQAFAFDRHFEDAGFSLSASSDSGAR
jgi:predicted nucleic acid-binding protein